MRTRGDRTPASYWVAALGRTRRALATTEANDFIFGSQAMSVYLGRGLPSKDLDLIVPGVSPGGLEKVRGALSAEGFAPPGVRLGIVDHEGRDSPVERFHLRRPDGNPRGRALPTSLGSEAPRGGCREPAARTQEADNHTVDFRNPWAHRGKAPPSRGPGKDRSLTPRPGPPPGAKR